MNNEHFININTDINRYNAIRLYYDDYDRYSQGYTHGYNRGVLDKKYEQIHNIFPRPQLRRVGNIKHPYEQGRINGYIDGLNKVLDKTLDKILDKHV